LNKLVQKLKREYKYRFEYNYGDIIDLFEKAEVLSEYG